MKPALLSRACAVEATLPPAPATPLAEVLEGQAYVRQSTLARALDLSVRQLKRVAQQQAKNGFPSPLPLLSGESGPRYPVPELLDWESRRLAVPRTSEERRAAAARVQRARKGVGAEARRELAAALQVVQ